MTQLNSPDESPTSPDSRLVLALLQKASGMGPPGNSQFEDLSLTPAPEAESPNVWRVKYSFDEDGFSQYDKTIAFQGLIECTQDGRLILLHLCVEHIGEGTSYSGPVALCQPSP